MTLYPLAEQVPTNGLFPELGHWLPVTDADPRLYALYKRHYSYEKVRNYPGKRRLRQQGRICKMQGFGDYMALLTPDCNAGWIWSRPPEGIAQNGQHGVACVLFRNESTVRSSDLIKEAVSLADVRWPGERLYTWVWDDRVRSTNPGYCYQMAGWHKVGRNKDGRLTLLEIPEKARSL